MCARRLIAVDVGNSALKAGLFVLDEDGEVGQPNSVVRLEVVDTNPRARGLYEREGYRVTRVDRFGYMRRFIGFGGVVAMELPIE